MNGEIEKNLENWLTDAKGVVVAGARIIFVSFSMSISNNSKLLLQLMQAPVILLSLENIRSPQLNS